MISAVGGSITKRIERSGRFAGFAWSVVWALFAAPLTWARWSRLGPQLFFIGSASAPVLALTGAFIGAILAIEGFDQFDAFGQAGRLGGVVNVSIVKQIGPVLATIMLAGRVGCSLTAELGSMRVTDQLDAMRVMGADPIRILATPRIVACVVMIPILTIVSNVCGIIGGWLVITQLYGVPETAYWDFNRWFIGWFDVANGLIKSVFFGATIGLVACYKGFHCRSGAQGVGRATTEGFVASFVAIVFINLVLAKLLNDIDSIWVRPYR